MGFFQTSINAFRRRHESLRSNKEYYPEKTYEEIQEQLNELDECGDLTEFVDVGMVDDTREQYLENGKNSIESYEDRVDAIDSMIYNKLEDSETMANIAMDIDDINAIEELNFKQHCLEVIRKALKSLKKCYPYEKLSQLRHKLRPLFEILSTDVIDE